MELLSQTLGGIVFLTVRSHLITGAGAPWNMSDWLLPKVQYWATSHHAARKSCSQQGL
jgi:hypothetical protein